MRGKNVIALAPSRPGRSNLLFRGESTRMRPTGNRLRFPSGAVVVPETAHSSLAPGSSSTNVFTDPHTEPAALEAAAILASHLFAQGDRDIPGVSYAVAYRLAEVHSGGDIVDAYQFDNDSVALSIADISGKGTQAAIHAALIKYGLRAYASLGLTAEKVMRAMDRLYPRKLHLRRNRVVRNGISRHRRS